MSYNPTGIDSMKCQWIRDLLTEFNVNYCAIQEHFKTVKTTDQWFRKQFQKFSSYVIPAHRAPGVDCGRGRGGLVQLSSKCLAVKRRMIVAKSPRIQAQLLTFPTCKIVWINSYLPCDPQMQNYDNSELIETLSEVESIVNNAEDCEVVWSADMNFDDSRDNLFTRTVTATLQRLSLTSVWEGRNIDYSHIHTDRVSTSLIDHFMVSHRLLELVDDCGPVHRGDNLSRHSPILLSLRLGELPLRPMMEQPRPPRMPAWDRATEGELLTYTEELHSRLLTVQCPGSMLHCRDPLCEDRSHSEDRDSVVLDILLSMVEVSYTSLPLTGQAGRGRSREREVIPGWSATVEPFRQRSIYCYRAWRAGGKPSHGDLHRAKLESHAQFRYAVRRVKRSDKLQQAKGLFEVAMAGDVALMKEMRRVQTGKGVLDELTDNVDGASGQQEVADKFGEVYSALYNSAGSQEEMVRLQERIRGLIGTEDSRAEVCKLSGETVKEAVTRMKPHRMDVSQGFTSDCLLHAPDILFRLLALVFQDWLIHGTVTKSILSCAFIPLLKSSLKDPAKTDSYRAIAGSSLLLKLFEMCVLDVWGDLLRSDSLQFGFKRGCGTSSATWLVQEVLHQFLLAGSKPIAVVLDCSKAFDLAKYNVLFERLLTDRRVPAIVVRVLAFSYQEQLAWVRWGRGCISKTFSIANGTRQGSIASPTFWAVYLDPLLSQLRREGVGCHLAGIFMGAVCYADDLILLAPNRVAAQKMLDSCEKFAADHNVKFSTDDDPNRSKCKAIYVSGPRGGSLPKPVPVKLCGRDLPWVARAEHLGHALCEDGTMRQDAREKRAKFIDCSVKIRETFNFAHPAELIVATEKYCPSLYGSNLYDFKDEEFDMICGAWKTGVKLAWGVHRGCRTYLLQQVLAPGVTSLRVNLFMRFHTFFRSMLASPSPEVQVVARLAARDLRSSVGSNLALLREESGGLDPWTSPPGRLKAALQLSEESPIQTADAWRVPYMWRLLGERLQHFYNGDTEEEERVAGLLNDLVRN